MQDISSKEVIKGMMKNGYVCDIQKGLHIAMRQCAPPHRRLIIPDVPQIAKGVLRALSRQTNLSLSDFKKITKK